MSIFGSKISNHCSATNKGVGTRTYLEPIRNSLQFPKRGRSVLAIFFGHYYVEKQCLLSTGYRQVSAVGWLCI